VNTIVFGRNRNLQRVLFDPYRNCASSPGNFFVTPTQQDLINAFRHIAGQLANLRLAQ
jgi:hypothetical protein